ncbi:MAG: hypothetical protein HGA41_04005 [Syntrophaceae bacterium]|nr:hypothetical protein [Syntrophaceae bacterium]
MLWTVLDISDGTAFWRVRTQLIDGLKSLMTHSVESDGSEEIIHQTEISPQCWHTIRTLKQAGKSWAVVMNNVTNDQPGQPVGNHNFCGNWSLVQMKAFGDIGQDRTWPSGPAQLTGRSGL